MRTRSSGSSSSDQDNAATPSPLTEEDEQEDLSASQEALYGPLYPIRGEQEKK